MKCPYCRCTVKELGACEVCLPFNIYYDPKKELTASRYEMCRKLMIALADKLRAMPFSQVGANGEVDEEVDGIVVKFEGRKVMMVPILDTAARKSVLFWEEREGIKEGHHRFR